MLTHHPSRDEFAGVLDTVFELRISPDRAIDARLIKVSDLQVRPQQEQFSLFFRVANETPVEQGVYELKHAQLDELALFLVPVGSTDAGLELQAVFNHLID